MNDDDQGVLQRLHSPGAPMLIAFGGISGGMAMPPYEFLRISDGLQANTIFLRDPFRAWYHRGVPGLGRNIDGCASSLERLIADQRPSTTVMVGNSAGGYAALLFSRLVTRVDRVVAFSPQTFIDRARRLIYLDRRWRTELRAVHNDPAASHRYFDLRPTLRPSDGRIVDSHIFVAGDVRLDRVHARRVASIRGVELHRSRAGGHSMIRVLRDEGILSSILQASLDGVPLPEPGSSTS